MSVETAYSPQWLAKALASTQTEFPPSDSLPDEEGACFLTNVPDAPVQASGRVGPDGCWYVGHFHLGPPGIADWDSVLAGFQAQHPGVIVLRAEPVAEAMIRYGVRGMMLLGADDMAARHGPGAWEAFLTRLNASRFSPMASRA